MATTYYQVLEVSVSASQEDIKKAFWALSKVHHPDIGGDVEKFKRISEAYTVLSDPPKRRAYNDKITRAAPRKVATPRPKPPMPTPVSTYEVNVTWQAQDKGKCRICIPQIDFDSIVSLKGVNDGDTFMATGSTGLKARIRIYLAEKPSLWSRVFKSSAPATSMLLGMFIR